MADLQPGEMKLTPSGGDFVKMPDGEPLKFHIVGVEKGEGTDFETGKPVPRLIVRYELDEEEAPGQTYLDFFNPVLHPKSKLGKMVSAVYGETPTSLDPVDLVGQPLRMTLKTKKNKAGEDRQWPDTYLKPAKDQKKVVVEKDVLPTADEVDNATIDVDTIPF